MRPVAIGFLIDEFVSRTVAKIEIEWPDLMAQCAESIGKCREIAPAIHDAVPCLYGVSIRVAVDLSSVDRHAAGAQAAQRIHNELGTEIQVPRCSIAHEDQRKSKSRRSNGMDFISTARNRTFRASTSGAHKPRSFSCALSLAC